MAPPPDVVEVVLVLSETVIVSSVELLVGEVLFVWSPRPLVAVSSSLVVTSSMGLLRSFRSLRSSSRAGWGGGGGISVGVGLQGKPEVGGYG